MRHLVNGNDVIRIEAGYIEYYQILFDEHQFIYAKGFRLKVSFWTNVPARTSKEAQTGLKDHDTIYSTLEVSEDILQTPNALELCAKQLADSQKSARKTHYFPCPLLAPRL